MNVRNFLREKIGEIKKKVKDGKALVATSGGVDSVTAAIIARNALKENLYVLLLDTGFLREGEPEKVRKFFEKEGINLEIWDVKDKFFEAMKGKLEPEEKRIAFREVFYKTLGQAVKSYSVDFLIQGTIAADIVETQKGIKTQHNVLSQIGINPLFFGLKIIEPLKELYKPDVRKLAKALGIPKKIYEKQPFPGPGLSIRVIGEVTPERIEKIRLATSLVEKAITSSNVFQAFPVLLSDKATGIVNGKRVYGDIIVIRAVESKDAITAKVYKIQWPKLEKLRKEIIKKVPGVVKVLYDITPKPPSTIEFI